MKTIQKRNPALYKLCPQNPNEHRALTLMYHGLGGSALAVRTGLSESRICELRLYYTRVFCFGGHKKNLPKNDKNFN